ncbi:MAG TPA: sterol desaturase family protein [Polyangiaceae bacterium]|jgi:sterol desaturase/sphingolipid hydroxylase (fatty acid hydroxylase superfamily)|nr:sterol desaturase family protein [Polyangiaceae bacterium]
MFESEFFDLFSRTHPIIVPALYVPGSLYLFYLSTTLGGRSVPFSIGLFITGFVTWTLVEYWLHRLFFHWQPGGKWGERLHFLVHGVHHTWPKDKYRLVMPPAVSITLYFTFGAIWYFLLGPRYGFGVHSGFVAGYMFYDLTHYWVHHFSPRTEYGRQLKKNHMLHHFKDPTTRFCVSNMVWDRWFGTSGSK